MKIIKITLLLIVFVSINCFAQEGKFSREKREQIRSMKIAFITNELSLTPDEAAKFWPLYNAFDEKQREIRRQKLKGYLDRMEDESFDKISEKEAASMLAQMEKTEDELFQLRKKFIISLKGVLPSVKILRLKKAEEDFNRKLLHQYRDKPPR